MKKKSTRIPKEFDIRVSDDLSPSDYRALIERLRAERPSNETTTPITITIEKITIKI